MYRLIEHNLMGVTMDMVYGLLAVGSAALAITSATGNLPVVEYGALGMCGFMVYFLCKHITALHKDHQEERTQFTEAITELSTELKNRPCLLGKEKEPE